MSPLPRGSGATSRRARALAVLLCGSLVVVACTEDDGGPAPAPDVPMEVILPDVAEPSEDVPAAPDVETDLLSTVEIDPDAPGDAPSDDTSEVGPDTEDDAGPIGDVAGDAGGADTQAQDTAADDAGGDTSDTSSDVVLIDAPDGSSDEDASDEPCTPGEPCTLEVSWDCVEGICTSLQTCAPTPIPGCCTKDLDCTSLDPPSACATFTCVNNLCTPEAIPGCCTTVADCSDNEPCTLDQCPQPGALCVHCPAGCPCPDTPPAFSTGFDEGFFALGWIISDANLGDEVGWHVSERRWLRPPYAAYIGDADCGTYSNAPLDGACEPLPLPGEGGTKITSTLKTPSIPLLYQPGGHVVLFWVWSEVDPLTTGGPGETDVLSVRVQDAFTQESWPLTSSLAVGKNTDGAWAMLGADLSPWTGLNVRLQFHFDTLQNLDNLHEGVYIDDIQVVPRCVGGCCTSDVECQGLALEDGCSQAKCIELDGGAGNVCAAVPTKPGELCQSCSDDGECSDGNPCTADSCSEAGTCEHAVFCCFEENAFATSFEESLTDFYVGDSNPDDGVGWKLTGQSAALGFSSAWIADEATSTYESGETVDVSLTTPTFNLPASSEVAGTLGLAFWLNLSTEWDGQQYSNPAGIDRLSVSVVQGPVATEVWSSDAVGGSTDGTWQPIEIELAQWAEAPIQIRFSFKSGDAVNNAFVGPIIDAIKVGRICPLE